MYAGSGKRGLTKNLQAIASKRNIILELAISLLHELFLIERITFHFLAAIEDRCCRVRVQELRTYALCKLGRGWLQKDLSGLLVYAEMRGLWSNKRSSG